MLHVSRTNLNLLVVLHAVLTEGSVTAAGKRLGLSQTAVSNALARLRSELGDPLVVRRGRGIVATPRATALLPELAHALATLEGVLAPSAPFDPRACTRTFTIALTDDQEIADLPRIHEAFRRELPHAVLRVETTERLVATDGLSRGTIDLALAPAMLRAPGVRSQPLFVEHGVLVARRDHPTLRGRVTIAQLEKVAFVDVRVTGDDSIGRRLAEKRLRDAGLTPVVRCSVPHFFAAAMLVATSDAVAGVPRRFAERVETLLPIQVLTSPLTPMELPLALFWHERTHADPASRYVRERIVEALAEAPRNVSRAPTRRRRA